MELHLIDESFIHRTTVNFTQWCGRKGGRCTLVPPSMPLVSLESNWSWFKVRLALGRCWETLCGTLVTHQMRLSFCGKIPKTRVGSRRWPKGGNSFIGQILDWSDWKSSMVLTWLQTLAMSLTALLEVEGLVSSVSARKRSSGQILCTGKVLF